MKQINTRTVRASVLGQSLMKQFGKKRGKQLIKSATVAFRFEDEGYDYNPDVLLTKSFVFAYSPQGHIFWSAIHEQHEILKGIKK